MRAGRHRKSPLTEAESQALDDARAELHAAMDILGDADVSPELGQRLNWTLNRAIAAVEFVRDPQVILEIDDAIRQELLRLIEASVSPEGAGR